jgi:hypothetical protein
MYNVVGRLTPVFSSSIRGCYRMKTTPLFPYGRGRYILVVVNLLLTIVLTVLSFRYVQPKDCYRFCDVEEGVSCPAGSCRVGEQKAGWPIPVFVDAPSPSSPLGISGVLGVEDLPLPMPMLLDVLFYSFLVWLAVFIIGLIQGQMLDRKLILLALPMNAALAVFLWVFYFSTGYGNYQP